MHSKLCRIAYSLREQSTAVAGVRATNMDNNQNLFEGAFFEYFKSINPSENHDVAKEIEDVNKSISRNGMWSYNEEWRISTYMEVEIKTAEIDSKMWFSVSVECDKQEFSCLCPSVEKAYLFSKLYRHIIVYQFYSIGPPWAE